MIRFLSLFIVMCFFGTVHASKDVPTPDTNTQIQELIKLLEDPDARDALIEKLKNKEEPSQKSALLPTQLVQPVVDRAIEDFSTRLEQLEEEFFSIWTILQDPHRLEKSESALISHLFVLGIGLGAFFVTLQVNRLRIFREKLTSSLPLFTVKRLGVLASALSLCAAFAYGTIAHLQIRHKIFINLSSLVTYMLSYLAIIYGIRILLAPKRPDVRLFPLSNETASHLSRNVAYIFYTQILSSVLCSMVLSVGKLDSLALIIGRLLWIVTGAFVIRLLVQLKKPLTSSLKRSLELYQQKKSLGPLSNAIVEYWFPLAIAYVLMFLTMIVFVAEQRFNRLIETMVLVTVILLGGYCAIITIPRISRKLIGFLDRLFHTPKARLHFYTGCLSLVLYSTLAFLMMYSFLSIFEVSLECFVEPSETRQLISKFLSVLLSAFIGLLLLETLEMVIVNIFQKIKASSKQKNLPSLMRLILNIMRSLVFALTLLMILSELGFNITPLLASAGVLGLAISLGSQTLFNDLIKGFFILTEDTLTIGDTVSFYISSAEYRGVVENITLRNVQLRDEKDQVHTIPFSTIGPIINESRPKHEIA